MHVKMPRWLVILEVLLLLGALGVLAYKAAIWVRPMPPIVIESKRPSPKSAAPTILDYYRQYPDRYIRVEDESWVLNRGAQSALHSFTLRNLATVAYNGIEIRITYESAAGQELLTRDIPIPEPVPAQGSVRLEGIKLNGVPLASKTAVVTVARAQMIR
jgi:hypothetical protein